MQQLHFLSVTVYLILLMTKLGIRYRVSFETSFRRVLPDIVKTPDAFDQEHAVLLSE